MNSHTIKKLFKFGVIAPAVLLAMQAGAQTQQHITPTPAFTNGAPATSGTQLATGQYITPTVIAGSVQQPLNPGLPAYPDFVAGDISSATSGNLITRIPLDGNGLGMTLDASQSKLYVAQDNADQVAVIDTATNTIIAKIDARAPAGVLTPGRRFAPDGPAGSDENERGEKVIGFEEDARSNDHAPDGRRAGRYTGAATYTVTLSPNGETLYAVNAGANSVAVIPSKGEKANTVRGLIPTAYEPHDITFSADGSWMYIVNGKSATGPNPSHLSSNTSRLTTITYPGGNTAAQNASNASNQYQFQFERASLVSAPVPTSDALHVLTTQVEQNNFYTDEPLGKDAEVINFVRDKIKHVIYIVKENRTFDQILGDLPTARPAIRA
jgi:YVTN family beta-propeller protein